MGHHYYLYVKKLNLEKRLNQKLDLYFLECLLENYGIYSIVVDGQNNNN